MTREEAIETLKANYPDACYEQLREAVDTAIEALDKQIPKKPTYRSGYPYDDRSASYGYCPECGLKQIVNTPKYFAQHDWYCRMCGQAIDWEGWKEDE